jgi:penicillin V acylase-like amidase (Ntn superfamily)
MRIVIPGDPIPKARHRSFIRNNHIATYDAQATEKNDFRIKLFEAIRDLEIPKGALKVDIIFEMDAF